MKKFVKFSTLQKLVKKEMKVVKGGNIYGIIPPIFDEFELNEPKN